MTPEEQVEHFKSLIGDQEELDDELEDYLEGDPTFGCKIRHPLVYSMMHIPALNGFVNRQLAAKRELLAEAEAAGEWSSYVNLHERPYRVGAFIDIMHNLNDVDYWKMLTGLWTDSENIRQQPDVWHSLLRSQRSGRECMMDEEDRADLAAMPEVIHVYQGHTRKAHDGWSWTLDRDKAIWFANRFSMFEKSKPMLTEGFVPKRHVIAYITNRGESEILVERRLVRDRTVTAL